MNSTCDQRSACCRVTTNPTIFASALANGDRYSDQLRQLAATGSSVTTRFSRSPRPTSARLSGSSRQSTTTSHGADGRVSIEVDPRLAHDTDETVNQAQVCGPRSTNRTCSSRFRLPGRTRGDHHGDRRRDQRQRHPDLLPAALPRCHRRLPEDWNRPAHGRDLANIHSVASFFVSRSTPKSTPVSTPRSPEATALKGHAAVANARLAYQAFEEIIGTHAVADVSPPPGAVRSARCGPPPV